MGILKKVFGGIEMTWKKTIIFSVVIAAITSVFLIFPIFDGNPLREMGVGFECWFLFAIFIVSNCKKTTEAGLKCFVFFLISQPLIYLFQQPFAQINLLKTYYFRWFILTLFTFPGGMLAYQIKRQDIWGALVLAGAGIFLGGVSTFEMLEYIFAGNLAYALYYAFFIIAAIALGFVFWEKKRNRIVYLAIVGVSILAGCIFTAFNRSGSGHYTYDIQAEGVWTIQGASSIDTQVSMMDEDTMEFEYKRNSYALVDCINEQGETIQVELRIENGQPEVAELHS